jgi:hypothetical protein
MKNKSMASLLGIFSASAVVILVAMSVAVMAVKEFKVGNDLGWMEPDANNTAIYSQWAESHRFHVGDSLCEFATLMSSFLLAFIFESDSYLL